MGLKFVCPVCGGNEIMIVITGVTEYWDVILYDDEDYVTEYHNETDWSSSESQYKCKNCLWDIPENIQDSDELEEWLRANQTKEEQDADQQDHCICE